MTDPQSELPELPELVELEIGPVAHGGHCVARFEGRVVFVRHTLPGERVRARLTGSAPDARFWRADAVEILSPSPGRVPAPCPHSGPGKCGGCDWQHVDPAAQRDLKAAVLTEQLVRLAHLTPGEDGVPPVVVEAVDGDQPPGSGLGWRTRMRFAISADGNAGLRKHRSHEVIPVAQCPISSSAVQAAGVGDVLWPAPMRTGSVEVVAPAGGDETLVVAEPAQPGRFPVPALTGATSVAIRQPSDGADDQTRGQTGELARISGRTWVRETAGDHRFRVTGTGFWQVHAGAPQTLLTAVLDAAAVQAGERVADLYCGAGLFSAGLAEATGPSGTIVAVEFDQRATKDARRSLHDLPQVLVETGDVARVLPGLGQLKGGADVVVLDPPRTGAGRTVMSQIAALRPRVIVYVACDPAALARDVATAAQLGYRLTGLRAFDLFPMTHHLECVATLTRG